MVVPRFLSRATGVFVAGAAAIVIADAAASVRMQDDERCLRYQKAWARDFNTSEFERLGGIYDDPFVQYMAGNWSHTSGRNMWVLSEMGHLTELIIEGPDGPVTEGYTDDQVVCMEEDAPVTAVS